MTKELQVIETETNTPLIVEAVYRYNMTVEYVNKVMREGIDYGKVPGTDKPTLLKPGAEKLQRLFNLRATFEAVDIEENWDKPFFYYRYKCQVWNGDQVITECEGSTNSYEKKYRYRYVFDNKATPEEKENGLRMERMSKKGRPYTSYRIENKEIFDQVNTLQKMAQKRAYVGAILLAANASEFFTQDMEDLPIVEVVNTVSKPVDGELIAKKAKPEQTEEPEQTKKPGWTSEQITAVAEAHTDKHGKQIVSTMNMSSKLSRETAIPVLLKWFRVYKVERDNKVESQVAADTADNKVFG